MVQRSANALQPQTEKTAGDLGLQRGKRTGTMSGMGTGIDPTVDYVFKRLHGDEDNALLLVDLLNAVIDFALGRLVRGVHILNPFVARDYAEGKVPVLDVRARDDPGRQFLLEMQRFVSVGFAKRLLYYWAGGHAEQLLKGDHYEILLPTYSICFVNEPFLPDADYHHCFQVYDKKHEQLLCKDLEMHLIELSKFVLPVEEVRTPLERWCYFFKHGASLDLASLPATLDVPVIRQAVEVLVKLSQDGNRATSRRGTPACPARRRFFGSRCSGLSGATAGRTGATAGRSGGSPVGSATGF